MPEVVITMPAYRAEATLARTVADIPAGIADRIIVVDDASPDETVRIARDLGIQVVVHPENRGYGGNQKTCYEKALEAGAEIVVLLHPDYQYDPKAVPLLIAPILAGDADMTFGSRFAGLGNPTAGGMPYYRFVGNRLTTIMENLLLGARFTDMHSGMRAYTRRCLLALPWRNYSDDFDFDSQLLVDAVTNGQRVVEVPIPTRYTKESSSINVVSSTQYIVRSIAYSARRSRERGRRGSRSPVAIKGMRRGARIGRERSGIERPCILCGATVQRLAYPASSRGSSRDVVPAAVRAHDDIVQCERCGLASAIPTVSGEEILRSYVDDAVPLTEEGRRRELFSWVADAIDGYFTPGRRMLEIGSNVGLFLDVAAKRGWDAHGIEPSRWAVEEGRRRYGVDVRAATIEEMDEPGTSLDVAVMLDVLEHLIDPLSALKRIRGAMKDEGLLVMSAIDAGGRHARARGDDWPWLMRSHLWYFSANTLDAMLKRAGFKMIEWTAAPRSFHLSYLAHRAVHDRPALGETLQRVSRVVDPKVPAGWLGDVVLVVARPDGAVPQPV